MKRYIESSYLNSEEIEDVQYENNEIYHKIYPQVKYKLDSLLIKSDSLYLQLTHAVNSDVKDLYNDYLDLLIAAKHKLEEIDKVRITWEDK